MQGNASISSLHFTLWILSMLWYNAAKYIDTHMTKGQIYIIQIKLMFPNPKTAGDVLTCQVIDICVSVSEMIGHLSYHSQQIPFIFHVNVHFLQRDVDVM